MSKTTYFLGQFICLTPSKITYCLIFVMLMLLNLPLPAQDTKLKKSAVNTVVIDAGHGGKDPGAIGAEIKEKDVCLTVSLMLGKLINNYLPDVKVIYTRDDDTFVKLYQRAEIANKNKADLFISIHVNAAQNKSAFGTETFVMGVKYKDANRDIAKRENSVIYLEDDYEENYDQNFVGFDPNSPMAEIIAGLIQQESQTQSIAYADMVEGQFVKRQNRRSRGVKQRVLLVMYRTAMPSVLVELGFLSNKEEHDIFKQKENLPDYAGSLFRAFVEYKRKMEGVSKEEIEKEEAEIFKNWEKYKGFLLGKNSFDKSMAAPAKLSTFVSKEEAFEKGKEELEQAQSKDELTFKVQIFSTTKKNPLTSHEFKGLKTIDFYRDGDLHKYTYGNCPTMQCAVKMQDKARKVGFDGSFVVAFYKGEKISIKKANEILAKSKNE